MFCCHFLPKVFFFLKTKAGKQVQCKAVWCSCGNGRSTKTLAFSLSLISWVYYQSRLGRSGQSIHGKTIWSYFRSPASVSSTTRCSAITFNHSSSFLQMSATSTCPLLWPSHWPSSHTCRVHSDWPSTLCSLAHHPPFSWALPIGLQDRFPQE